MKFKRVVPIMFSILILLGGCSSFSSVPKDKVMVENTNENDAKISKEEAKEIAVDCIKKSYNIKEDKKELKSLINEVKFIKSAEETLYLWNGKPKTNAAWKVIWDKEENKDYSYNVLVDATNGKMIEIQNYVGVDTKNIKKRKSIITLKQAKEKAFDFLGNTELVSDISKLKLLHIYGEKINTFIFLYNEKELMYVDVDTTLDKVSKITHYRTPFIYMYDDIDMKIKKEKAVEIALDGIEKYFNVKVDREKLAEDIHYYPQFDDESNEIITPARWDINWNDLKLREENKEIGYSATIDANTGELRYVNSLNIDLNKESLKISDEEMKKIALDFIEKSKYISDINELKEPKIKRWRVYGKERASLEYKYKDEILWVCIDFTNKEVFSIGYR
ncbi:YcdB/YcdC domain-containing protein [Tepidibacter mesophilus]|uniref:YcdB/YcdC domain-containing protein n=1 Tax=Tepidibacter mesophilus TaxID=655607 RepID=UPI000C081748|nr:YcdB/YcdC domain-containing protein [Tepidibacter mesophilus]